MLQSSVTGQIMVGYDTAIGAGFDVKQVLIVLI